MSPEFHSKTCLCMELSYFWRWELPMEEANCFGSRRSTMPIRRTLHSSVSLALVKTTTQKCMTWRDNVHKWKTCELSFKCHARDWIRRPAWLASLAKEPFGPTTHIPVQSCKSSRTAQTHMTLMKNEFKEIACMNIQSDKLKWAGPQTLYACGRFTKLNMSLRETFLALCRQEWLMWIYFIKILTYKLSALSARHLTVLVRAGLHICHQMVNTADFVSEELVPLQPCTGHQARNRLASDFQLTLVLLLVVTTWCLWCRRWQLKAIFIVFWPIWLLFQIDWTLCRRRCIVFFCTRALKIIQLFTAKNWDCLPLFSHWCLALPFGEDGQSLF